MTTIDKKTNQLLITIFIKFYKMNQDRFILTFEESYNRNVTYCIIPKGISLSNKTIVEKLNNSLLSQFNIFNPKNKQDKELQLNVHCSLEKEFYLFMIQEFPNDLIDSFYQIAGRFFSLDKCLSFLDDDDKILKQFTLITAKFQNLLSNDALKTILNTIMQCKAPSNTKLQAILQFCNNNKILFKRVETQNILYNIISSYPEAQNLFNDFQTHFIKTEPIFNVYNHEKSFILYINKIQAFNQYYNSLMDDKQQFSNILQDFVDCLKNNEVNQKLNIKDAFLEKTESIDKEFLIILIFNDICQHSSEYLCDMIDYALQQVCFNSCDDRKKVFSTALFHYVLQKTIPKKTESNQIVKSKKI